MNQDIIFNGDTLILQCINKQRFTKREKSYFIKQASKLLDLRKECDFGITNLRHFFMSSNFLFSLFE